MKTKRILAIVLAATALLSMGVISASAADETEALSTEFTFEYKNDPTYSITIPSTVVMTKEGVQMDIVATDVAYLDNQKISVTIADTDKYRNQMIIEGKTEDGKNASMRYQLVKADGTVIETTGGKNQVNGVELASFTENGTATLTVLPVISNSSSVKKGVTYTGSMTYGIELVALD